MKRLLTLLAVLSLLVTCGCASSEGDKITPVDNVEMIEFGKIDATKHLLQIDFIPSVIVGYGENDEVVYIASNNADGYEFLEKHDAVKMLGEPISATINAIMLAAYEDGYDTDEFTAAISYVDEENADIRELMRISREAVALCDFDIKVMVDEETEIIYSAETGVIEPVVCYLCHGQGTITCEDCSGTGVIVVIERREETVRNSYVCEVCGGKGWIIDAWHGGAKGNCDSCGGIEGKMPSGPFREKAYDTVVVEEEITKKHITCDGSGLVECPECNGSGSLH